MTPLVIRLEGPTPSFSDAWTGVRERFEKAVAQAVEMARSMIEDTARADIAGAGNFGESWTSGLQVRAEGALPMYIIYMTHNRDYAGIFETGGVISGHPYLWLPISGTDAALVGEQGNFRAADYGGLFSARYPRTDGGPPLLFALSDKLPRYFGVESVTIPQKFHLNDDVKSVMANFRQYFDAAFHGGAG